MWPFKQKEKKNPRESGSTQSSDDGFVFNPVFYPLISDSGEEAPSHHNADPVHHGSGTPAEAYDFSVSYDSGSSCDSGSCDGGGGGGGCD